MTQEIKFHQSDFHSDGQYFALIACCGYLNIYKIEKIFILTREKVVRVVRFRLCFQFPRNNMLMYDILFSPVAISFLWYLLHFVNLKTILELNIKRNPLLWCSRFHFCLESSQFLLRGYTLSAWSIRSHHPHLKCKHVSHFCPSSSLVIEYYFDLPTYVLWRRTTIVRSRST